ncbi:unnamed protein product [marine sediment metagenome]|uniref:SCP2 domain-containing protein n=1 Tax=marine sediment metagenome TaxID=412755 RepID=X1EKQ8_9ZZZZ
MVDEDLIKYIKEKLNDGGNITIEDTLKLLKVYKQISTENEKLKEEFEDMAMLDMSFLGQIIISDENKKFWLEFKEGKVDFGEGDGENPTLTFTTTMNIFSGILFGQIEIVSGASIPAYISTSSKSFSKIASSGQIATQCPHILHVPDWSLNSTSPFLFVEK